MILDAIRNKAREGYLDDGELDLNIGAQKYVKFSDIEKLLEDVRCEKCRFNLQDHKDITTRYCGNINSPFDRIYIYIAQEYAEECCKHQRVICADVAFTIKQKGLDGILPDNEKQIMDRILNRITNAPLATEAQNGK